MHPATTGQDQIDPRSWAFYRRTMHLLNEAQIPFLVGGAYALARYSAVERHTRDFDIFVRKTDVDRIITLLSDAGYDTDFPFPHWLAKAYDKESQHAYVDIIFSSGNGVADVDDKWFERAANGVVLGMEAKLCPPEEILWSKVYIMERERFDGADVAHLIKACAHTMDWNHLLERFGDHWRVLFAHLILFGFIWPGDRAIIPSWVMETLISRLQSELEPPPLTNGNHLCQGTLLSREQYLIDIDRFGYHDARLEPRGKMSDKQIKIWTEAIVSKYGHDINELKG
jgi:hypothetical protein